MGRLILQSAWRALLDTMRPRMLVLSLLPLAAAGIVGALGYALFWDDWTTSTSLWIGSQGWLLDVLQALGWSQPARGLASMIVAALGIVALLLLSLLLVSAFVMPSAAAFVARSRYAQLRRRSTTPLVQSLLWSIGVTAAGTVLLVVSLPLWIIPVIGLAIAPLIWGWMTAKMFAFDALASFASGVERRQILRSHRWPLLAMGVACSYLGMLPTLLFGLGWLALALLPVLMLLSLWLYALAVTFAALWFVHYLFATLVATRACAPSV